jgi:tetratricopeptide (TPR) repeat protein
MTSEALPHSQGFRPLKPSGARGAVATLIVLALTLAASAQTPPDLAPRATLERVAALLEGSDLAAARTAADSALRDFPRDPGLHNLAGVIDARQGAFEAAESRFLTAIRLAPRSAPAYTNLGRLYQERAATMEGGRAKALDVYRRLLAFDPANVEGGFQAGFLLALDGAFAESRTWLERLPADVRARPQVLAVLATDLEGVGDAAAARAALTTLSTHPRLTAADIVSLWPAFEHLTDDRLPQAMLEALDARRLASPADLQRLAAIHLRHGRAAVARSVLERAASVAPAAPVLVDLARVAWKLGDAKGALGYLAHARSIEPQNSQVHFLFGMICVDQNLGREAYDSLKQAVALDPQNALVNYAMGAVAISRRDPSEAIPWFETYVRLVPDDPRGRFALGAARFHSNQLEDARRDLEVAARAPQTATGAHYFLARIARQLGDESTARREIDLTLAANATYADAWAELGLLQTRAGQYTDAEASLTKALALDSDNYEATRNLAALYGRTRDPRRAAQEARLAALIEQREARMQDFLRLVQVVP